MNKLKEYVDSLFRKYRQTSKIRDLKEEVYTNLEAKRMDLIAAGFSPDEAFDQVRNSITEVDSLIEGNIKIDRFSFCRERMQWMLISLLSVWVITIPLRVFYSVFALSYLLAFVILIAGVYYIYFLKQRGKQCQKQTVYVNILYYRKVKRVVWVLWSMYFLFSFVMTTCVYFGSNLWFSRPVHIDGPYALGNMLVNYFLPLLTIVIPFIFGLNERLALKYEVE
ncbi:hypothetical protein FL966_04200 [Caproiciproducens galactitolivorans]|uniref:Uncharacterized protein n=1 Tax=Caproiciproducens galactitolivorans TaxID=642589 RepID=A0A4Z0Y4Y2_9FIRM|nr:permease prefix domain 1-containing protein [Caproiciproducens galactitolivorans]QEY34320.1 hypothetical protein FL966_04200 [Caproiciproducens galactitolivorans]TGJ77917.1 hypothetical protein CAGA_03260 [Caproiciproducens galactitolivorans]